MTVLRRTGSLAIIPGTPTIPATPGFFQRMVVPDPPSTTKVIFNSNFGNVGIPLSALFPGGTVIVNEAPAEKVRVPVEPSVNTVNSYNGQKGTFLVVTFADGRRMVVRQ